MFGVTPIDLAITWNMLEFIKYFEQKLGITLEKDMHHVNYYKIYHDFLVLYAGLTS